ncbi:MAG: hypothetical protein OXC38_07540 [Gammaproteobacteria bacterium]|nr:hypothetical protein [Gammaproteobacteria bacterium]
MVDSYAKGIFLFRSPRFFRKIKGEGRDDMEEIGSYETDGILHRDVGDDRPIQPAFMMSFSTDVEATRKFGEYYYVLRDLSEFEKCLREALPSCITSIEWGEVEYTKTMKIDSPLINPSDDWHRKYFCKPERFSDEKEWRLIFWFLHTFRPLNETMEMKIPALYNLLNLKKHSEEN